MVRNAARLEQTRRAAALTPSTSRSFVPSRKRSSSGLFDVGALATHVHSRSSVSMPTPSLILPITGPGVDEATRSRSSYPPLPPIAVPRRKKAAPKPTTWDRVSDAASMLGFAAAWVATTGLGAVVVAALMTRDQAPPASTLTALSGPPAQSEPAAVAPCPRPWEPPLYSINDLPVVSGARHAAIPPVWAHVREATPAPPVVPVVATPPRHFESAPLAASRKTEGAPAVTLRPARAKTATAQPAGPPHSLEDWIRRAVSSDGKQSHSS